MNALSHWLSGLRDHTAGELPTLIRPAATFSRREKGYHAGEAGDRSNTESTRPHRSLDVRSDVIFRRNAIATRKNIFLALDFFQSMGYTFQLRDRAPLSIFGNLS